MESFFIEPENLLDEIAKITGEEFHHLVRVSRKKQGELIYLFDGSGFLYTAKILSINKESALCQILEKHFMKGELPSEIALAQSLLKSPERFEFAIEKATELGARKIFPLITERVISHRSKLDRWRKIILSACKQSNRALIPEITEPISFEELVKNLSKKFNLKILLHESDTIERKNLFDKLDEIKKIDSAIVLVGPEGGFTEKEVKTAIENGFEVVSLGERRLRSETAGVVALSILTQFEISKNQKS